MKKISLKFFITSAIILTSFSSLLFFVNNKALAVDALTITTTQYSALSASVFILGGAYSDNIEKKSLTTYFQYKKDNSDFKTGAQETIPIVRPTALKPVQVSDVFYSSPELKLASTYYFQAVGYYTYAPNQKFYGDILTLNTGSIAIVTSFPFVVEGGNAPVPYTPVTCTSPQVYFPPTNSCVAIKTCVLPQILNNLTNDCVSPPSLTCTLPQVLNTSTNTCITPPPITCTLPQVLSTSTNTCINPNNPPSSTGSFGSLVQCGTSTTKPCEFKDIIILINKVIHFILYGLALPIAAIMFAYAGFLLVTSGGSTESRGKAKKIFTNTAIGFIIAVASFLIIQIVLTTLGYKDTWTGF